LDVPESEVPFVFVECSPARLGLAFGFAAGGCFGITFAFALDATRLGAAAERLGGGAGGAAERLGGGGGGADSGVDWDGGGGWFQDPLPLHPSHPFHPFQSFELFHDEKGNCGSTQAQHHGIIIITRENAEFEFLIAASVGVGN